MTLLIRRSGRAERFPWTRYWIRRGATVLLDGHGFLAERRNEKYFATNEDLRTLDELEDARCLLLAGDPGLGKSREVEDYAARIKARIEALQGDEQGTPDALVTIDAPELDTAEEARRRIFDDPTVTEWKAGTGRLFLIIDSLDESVMRPDVLGRLLLAGLQDLPRDRLRLRIACRTAERPGEFLIGLQPLFNQMSSENLATASHAEEGAALLDESVAEETDGIATVATQSEPIPPSSWGVTEVELVGLTRRDASIAAKQRLGSDAEVDTFLTKVDVAGAGVFAAQPQTLIALLERHISGETLAASQAELFRSLALRLTEPGPIVAGRHVAAVSTLSARDRYRVVARLCAMMIFGNRRLLWLGDVRPADQRSLVLSDVVGTEYFDEVPLQVDERALRDAVNTSFFTATGEAGLAGHHTLAEFMAAEWVIARDLPLVQVRSLLTDPVDRDQRVVPQLRQVAAWLAAGRKDVFKALIPKDPDVVLWSDVVQLPLQQRLAVARALMEATTENTLLEPPWGARRPLERLTHPGLGHFLPKVLRDKSVPFRTRDLALDIAAACSVASVAPTSVKLALDTSEPLRLRVNAARVVRHVGSELDRRELEPLATAPVEGDDTDDLKGAALEAGWQLLAPKALFTSLTPQKRSNYGGSYAMALGEIAEKLPASHLSAGAAWLSSAPSGGPAFDRLKVRVFELGFDSWREPGILPALARYARGQMARYDRFFGLDEELQASFAERLASDPEGRHALLSAIVEADPGNDGKLYYLTDFASELFPPTDVAWAINRLADLPAGDLRRAAWVTVIQHRMDVGSAEHMGAAIARRDDPDVCDLAWGLPRDHESVETALAAVAARRVEHQDREAGWRERASVRDRERAAEIASAAVGPLAPRLARALDIEGDVSRKWRAILNELLRDDAGHLSSHFNKSTLSALLRLRGSELSDPLVTTSVAYLTGIEGLADPAPEGQPVWGVTYGSAAALALVELAPERLGQVPKEAWESWMPSLLHYDPIGEEGEPFGRVFRAAVERAPDTGERALLHTIRRRLADGNGWLPDPLLDVAMKFSPAVARIEAAVSAGEFDPDQTQLLVEALVRRNPAAGYRAAERILRTRNESKGARTRAVAVAAALMRIDPGPLWPRLKAFLDGSDVNARAILERAASSHDLIPSVVIENRTDDELAHLYLLVERLYPHEKDPWHLGVFSPTARDNLIHWRSQLLRSLTSRRQESAVVALERIARANPTKDWLVQQWLEAKAALRSERWAAPSIQHLLRLADRYHARIVESGAQLLDVVEESLVRLQEELQGKWRGVIGLWDQRPKGFRPKREEHLSNVVARHLERDLKDRNLIIGRELVLQVGIPGGAAGLRTDIDIAAVLPGKTRRDSTTIRAVVEIKGSWNPDLLTAMNAQLVNKYLDPHSIGHGIFLVGHYSCKPWLAEKDRTRSNSLGGLVRLSATLGQQATALTTSLREVRAVVLDTALPAADPARSKRKVVKKTKKRNSAPNRIR